MQAQRQQHEQVDHDDAQADEDELGLCTTPVARLMVGQFGVNYCRVFCGSWWPDLIWNPVYSGPRDSPSRYRQAYCRRFFYMPSCGHGQQERVDACQRAEWGEGETKLFSDIGAVFIFAVKNINICISFAQVFTPFFFYLVILTGGKDLGSSPKDGFDSLEFHDCRLCLTSKRKHCQASNRLQGCR